MVVDKHSQDAFAKLYAEWVSAGVKLSLAGFTASAKILEAAGQSVTAARAKANEAIKAREAGAKTDRDATPAAAFVPEEKPFGAPVAEPAAPVVDDLKRISGIGPKLEQMLVRKGIRSFAAIAALSADEVATLDADLNLNGRIQRDDWMGQAAKLAG